MDINIIIVESVIYIAVGIIAGYLLKNEELKKIKRVILIFYLIIGIAVYNVLYFIILSAGVLLVSIMVLKYFSE
ncbi:MAG: hypothetical protein M0Z86_02880 [Deltaproteobacteria bacterium]|nr:hypothetical protein [Deltaproteobacteria bacterium]